MSKTQELNVEFLLKKTISDRIADEVKTDRDKVFEALQTVYDELGAKSLSVKLPDGSKVATFTITEPKPKDQIDDDKLIAWLEDNGYGDQVLTKTVPAHEVKSLKTGFLKAIGAELADDGQYVTPAGELVEGIKQLPAAAPKSFSVKYEGGEAGRQRVIDAYLSGELGSIDPGANLPAVEAGNLVEADDDIVDVEPVDDEGGDQ